MTSKPEMRYGGVTQAVIETPPYQPTLTKSAHILLSFVLLGRGTDKPTMVDADGLSTVYGAGALESPTHFTHQSKYLQMQLSANGHAVVKRIILDGAKKAMQRVSLELIPAHIPIYKVDRDWRPVYEYDESTGAYSKIVLGYREGHRAVIHVGTSKYPTQYREFGLGTRSNYRLGNVIGFNGDRLDGKNVGEPATTPSIIYPLFDVELAEYGSFGNAVTMAVTEFIDRSTPYNSAMANIVIKESGTPMINADGVEETRFSLTPVGDSDASLTRSIQQAFLGGYNSLLGRIKTYDDEIALVTKTLAQSETALVDAAIELNEDVSLEYPHEVQFMEGDSSAFMFNILTGKNNQGLDYINGDFGTAINWDGAVLTQGEAFQFEGGSDGYPYTATGELDKLLQLRLYDEAVRAELKSMADISNPYVNMARHPYTAWYDSGYAMDTKFAAFNILKHRPEVTVIQTPYSVAEYGTEVIIPEISCAGATNSTGTITLEGTFDIYAGKTLVLANATPEQYLEYMEGTGNFKGTVTPEEVPWAITCAGALNYVDIAIYITGSPESQAAMSDITLAINGEDIPLQDAVQYISEGSRMDVVAPPVEGYAVSVVVRWANLRNIESRVEIRTGQQVDADGKPYVIVKPMPNSANPTAIGNADSTLIGFCLAPTTP